MPNLANTAAIELLKEKLSQAKSFAIVEYSGTTGNDQVELRRVLAEAGAEFRVAKNTLMRQVAGRDEMNASFEGQNAFVFSYEDEIGGLKALFSFHQEKDKLVIKQGLMGDKVLSAEDLESLSKLPSKNQLIATLISRIQGPVYGLVNVLTASQRDLVYALKAVADKLGESSSTQPVTE
ncbi:MAG: 50S ribosomal protein L10 [Candidatus Pacebacteria bacterium]|nr:50S ribosomal protein L10 [Candidatus Paceibacterota bacterium]